MLFWKLGRPANWYLMNHLDLGHQGEEMALDHLRKEGYEILCTNWRFRKYEVDIIGRFKDEVIFFEVKLRSGNTYGEPHVFVGKKKQKNLINAADAYAQKYEIDQNIRFDIIGITLNHKPEINHITDAFHT